MPVMLISHQKSGANFTFSCLKSSNDVVLLSLVNKKIKSNLVDDSGKFSLLQSKKDKIETNISGEFTKSKDGVINLITGFSKVKILKDFKSLYGVKLTLKSNSDEKIKEINFNLNGSSKNLNILESKCNSFK